MPLVGMDEGDKEANVHQANHLVHHQLHLEARLSSGGSPKENVAEPKQLSIILSWGLAVDHICVE